MKKPCLRLLSAFAGKNSASAGAVKIFFLAFILSWFSYSAFAVVNVTPATGGTTVCNTTVGCTTLGNVVITEGVPTDFAPGTDALTLSLPAGWTFCASTLTITAAAGGDVSTGGISYSYTGGNLVITFTGVAASSLADMITISGIQVQTTSTSIATVNMYASAVTGINGVNVGPPPAGTDFGALRVIPGIMTGLTTHCVGEIDNYAGGLATGGIWSTSSTAASVDGSGNVTFLAPTGSGGVNIIYTLFGCTSSLNVVVNKTPGHSETLPANIFTKGVCAWFDTFYVYNRDSVPAGYWSSGGLGTCGFVTVVAPAPGGHGTVFANCPGRDYICFTLATGCSVCDTFDVNPLPSVIMGNDTICAGTMTGLSDLIGGGKWTSNDTTLVTIDSTSGITSGIAYPGTFITYTLPTGCKRDTFITVNPLPDTIRGNMNLCIGSTTTLTTTTLGGVWTSSDTNVVKIAVSGGTSSVLQPISVGTATITLTIAKTGCFITTVVQVNPLPLPITANQGYECVGESIIQLSDATTGGTWSVVGSNASVDLSGVVTGLSAGTEIISYILGTGCGVAFTVTINPLPDTIRGLDSFCMGTSTLYTTIGSTPGGTWSGSPSSVITVFPSSGVTDLVFGVSAGVATITYMYPTGCYTTKTVTVNPLPDTISGPHVVCIDQTVTLSDATPGVIWSSSNTSVAEIDSFSGVLITGNLITPTPGGIGTTNIIVTLPTGCTNSAAFTFTVTPRPTLISGIITLCMGDNTTLTELTAPGGTWISDNTPVATIDLNTGVWTAISPGTSVITYTVSTGCFITTTVTVNQITPITGPNTICQGDSIVIEDTTLGGIFTTTGSVVHVGPTVPGTTTTGRPSETTTVYGDLPGVQTITYTTALGCKATFTVTVFPLQPITGQDSVCVNDSTKLFNSLSPAGYWLSGNTAIATIDSVTGMLHGIASGTVLIMYVMPSGCISYFPVRVNNIPDPIVTPEPSTVCQGYTVTFADALLGGLWSNDTLKFGSIDPVTGIYTSKGGGLDTIRYTFPTGCYVKDTVRIFPLLPIYGSDTLCVNDTRTLFDTTAPIGSGTWISDNTPVATIDPVTGLVTGITAGTATITYLLPTGCQATDTVVVNPLPDVIDGVDSVCVGATTVFSDATPGGTWSSGKPSIAIIDPATGVITGITKGTTTITYKMPTGCYVIDSVKVNSNPSDTFGQLFVCLSFTTTLSDPTPGGVWSTANTSIAGIDSVTGFVTGNSAGVTTISYTLNTTGCYATHNFTVFGQPPIVAAEDTSFICRGGSTVLHAAGADLGPTVGTYIWSPAAGLSCTRCDNPIATPTVTTTYTIIGTTFYGCRDTISITLNVDSLLNHIAVTGEDSLCIGTCAHFIASGRDGSLFAWTPTTGLSCTICDTTTACPTETTLYHATAIDRYGCKDSVAKRLVVMPLPVLDVYAAPHEFPIFLCRGTPLQLYAFGAWSYVWSPNLFLSCDSCANPIATDTFNLQYLVTGYTRFGCVDSIKVNVSVLDTNINTVSNDTDICYGDNAQLFATSRSTRSSLDIPKFHWTPEVFLDDPYSSHPISVAPNATVVYTLVTTENRCFSDTQTVAVRVQPYPVVEIPKASIEYVGTRLPTVVQVRNTPIRSYVWTPSAYVSCDTCDSTYLTPVVNTTYTVTVTSIYGCTSYDTVTVMIGCDSRQVFIPNTFTPNGDGMNDRFYVSGKGLANIQLFEVYNRWGEQVYHVENISPNDPASGWDGTYKGKVLEPDVFVYVVKATCALGGTQFSYKGDVSLVR